MFLAGQKVQWPVRAQGVTRIASGPVIAEVPAGGRPCDYWPKGKKKPEGRQLRHFKIAREHAFVIVEEVDDSGVVWFRTPRITAPVTLVPRKKERVHGKKSRSRKVPKAPRGREEEAQRSLRQLSEAGA